MPDVQKQIFHYAWYRGWKDGWMDRWMDGWIDGTGLPCLIVNILLFIRSHLFRHPLVNLSWSHNLLGLWPFIIMFVYLYMYILFQFFVMF